MGLPFSETTFVKDIVNTFPKSSDIFKQNRIDFCCGGNRPLKDAAAERNVDIADLMRKLQQAHEAANQPEVDFQAWLNEDSAALIEHIQVRYHAALKEELSMLSPYVTKVSKVHGVNHPELVQMKDLFYRLKEELLLHTDKEDQVIFPELLSLIDLSQEKRVKVVNEITMLEQEHDSAGSILKELRKITNDFTPPLSACGTYRLVFNRLELLEGETFNHIHLENNILFPRILDMNE